VFVLGAACAVAALPCAAGLSLLEHAYGPASHAPATIGWRVLVGGLALSGIASLLLHRRVPLRPPWRAALAFWAATATLAFTDAALTHTAPFRFGLLSLLLYLLPALLIAAALNARRPQTAAVLVAAATVLPTAAAYPIGTLQRHIAAAQWMHAQGIAPGRTVLQVLELPGLQQEPYRYDPSTGQLTAIFDVSQGWLLGPIETAAETVITGDHPCAAVLVVTGDAYGPSTPDTCQVIGDGTWKLGFDQGQTGFAQTDDAVTVTVTGPPGMASQLAAALRTAHPATDADLFTRIPPAPLTLTDGLLL
jgi:hypothetical protein